MVATPETVDVLGVRFENVTLGEALLRLTSMLEDGGKHYVATPNSEIVYECLKNTEALAALSGAGLTLPDGAGVVLASKILGRPLKQKVAGVDVAMALPEMLAATGKSLFLYGGKPGVAEKAAESLLRTYPALRIAGTLDGYVGDTSEVLRGLNASGADVVYVCLGAPKQEIFMHKYRDQIDAPLLLGLGGSIDVMAGVTKRAPDFFIRLGLEWFYRLLRQPSRIIRMTRLPLFLLKAIAYRLTHGKG